MSIYDNNQNYRRSGAPSGGGILLIIGAALLLGLALIIGLSFIYGSTYDSMRGGNDADARRELPQVNQPQQSQATPYLPDARSPDLGNNNDQQGAPANP